mmetsp:Transcript_24442/g.61877  ORF Transcript_24442/g.61877 Transcript_24442/m.61877 type:complete len:212 (-) Transcript_24442:77-712(-)
MSTTVIVCLRRSTHRETRMGCRWTRSRAATAARMLVKSSLPNCREAPLVMKTQAGAKRQRLMSIPTTKETIRERGSLHQEPAKRTATISRFPTATLPKSPTDTQNRSSKRYKMLPRSATRLVLTHKRMSISSFPSRRTCLCSSSSPSTWILPPVNQTTSRSIMRSCHGTGTGRVSAPSAVDLCARFLSCATARMLATSPLSRRSKLLPSSG